MNITPSNDFTIVKALKQEKQTKSGIIMPELEDETIIAIGEVVFSNSYKVGDILLYNRIAPFDFKVGDEKLFAVPPTAIIGVLSDTDVLLKDAV